MPLPKKDIKHPLSVETDDETPISVLVSSIHKVADGLEKIQDSGLTEYAIILLLHDATKVGEKGYSKGALCSSQASGALRKIE